MPVTIRRNVEYRATDTGALTLDLYYPPDSNSGAQLPAVVFVFGYSDLGAQAMLRCKLKEMGAYVSWAQLAAASGLAAINYTTREPATDLHALLQYIRQNAASLGIDRNRIGVWVCSGNVPMALSVLMQEGPEYLKCAVLCYGVMLDLDGSTVVADLAKTFGFVNPCLGKSVQDLPRDTPLFIVRAGQQLRTRLIDLFDDSETSREMIRQILTFMRFHPGVDRH